VVNINVQTSTNNRLFSSTHEPRFAYILRLGCLHVSMKSKMKFSITINTEESILKITW